MSESKAPDMLVDVVAVALWREQAGPNSGSPRSVYEGRTLDTFNILMNDTDKERWRDLARAALAAIKEATND